MTISLYCRPVPGQYQFQNKYDSKGAPRTLIKKVSVTDVDGEGDLVWHVVGGQASRVVQVARQLDGHEEEKLTT